MMRSDPDRLLEELVGGSRPALARALTELERQSPEGLAIERAVPAYVRGSFAIGITGPPGAGKSTLVNALISGLRATSPRVGVIAVDPTNPISGGAILGDRVRMTAAISDLGVFVRSLASRGALGGLTPAAVRMIDAFDAYGADPILIETVGTGQSEIDVAGVADLKLVVTAPGLGDGIQAMKGGVLDIADIIVVNKGDRPDAEATRQQIEAVQHIRADRAPVPVHKVAATGGEGIAALLDKINELRVEKLSAPILERRRRRARYLLEMIAHDIVRQRIGQPSPALERALDDVLSGTTSPVDAATRLLTPKP